MVVVLVGVTLLVLVVVQVALCRSKGAPPPRALTQPAEVRSGAGRAAGGPGPGALAVAPGSRSHLGASTLAVVVGSRHGEPGDTAADSPHTPHAAV